MFSFIKKHQKKLIVFLVLLAGFVLRIVLVNKVIVGDLLAYLEWGQRYRDWGGQGYYFGQHAWTYSPPNYPPISSWIFAGLSWLYQHRFWTAQLHNLIRFPPAVFIVYFYKYGEVLLFKLLPILADLGLGIIIYKLVKKFTKSYARAIGAMAFFVLNPVTIFISGAWGQTDSFVAIIGMLSFLLLLSGRVSFSMLLFFLGMYFKPTWGLLIPFYLYVLYLKKPALKSFILGSLLIVAVLIIVSWPFAEGNLFVFTKKVWFDRYFLPIRSAGRASPSAFNLMTFFLKIDRDSYNAKILGILTANLFGLIAYAAVNVFAFKFVKRTKNLLWGVVVGIFTIGLGSFLFMSNMLERYFFPALAPMVIIMFTDIKTLVYGAMMNLILFANIIWSFYRRGSDEIDHPFTNNNFLLIRVLSLAQVLGYALILRLLRLGEGRLPNRESNRP